MTKNSIFCFTLTLCLAFFACKKVEFQDLENNTLKLVDKLSAKVKPWLETQKSTHTQVPGGQIDQNKDATIDLIKDNLEFNKVSIEQIDKKNRYFSIPLKDAFLDKKKIDRNVTLVLLLNIDSLDNINAGGLVYFEPANGKKYGSFPPNTFRNMFSRKPVEFDGIYKMLSISGTWLSQFEVKNKKLHSTGVVTKKTSTERMQSTMNCTDWYMHTTYYWSDGTTTETWEFLRTICSNGCGNGNPTMVQIPCDDGGGGGGGDYEINRDEELYIGGGTLDPSGSGHLLPVSYDAHVSVLYMANSKVIVSVNPQKPTATPPSQYFVDANGNLAQASVSIDNLWNFSKTPLLGGTQYLVRYDFTSRWYYTYSSGTLGPFSFNEVLTKLIGPF